MTNPLVIFTPLVNVRSETFIRRHIEALLPNETAVVSGDVAEVGEEIKGNILLVRHLPQPRFREVLTRAFLEKAGWQTPGSEMKAVRKFLAKNGVRVALGEYLDYALPWLDICRDMGIRFFVHAHGYDASRLIRDEYWRAQYRRYEQSDGVIVVNQIQRDRLLALGIPTERIHLIPYGVDVPAQPPMARNPDGLIRCVAVGRMVPKKAPILCLDAFRRAAEVIPSLRLNFVGAGKVLSAARQFVRAFALEDKVTLMGSQPSEVVNKIMKNSDIFIQHSVIDPENGDEEGLPVSILEAMAGGLPVVSTRHAGIPEEVLDGVTGLLVNEGDSEGMAQNIIRLCRDDAWRWNMGNAGWKHAGENFKWERNREALLKVMGLQHD